MSIKGLDRYLKIDGKPRAVSARGLLYLCILLFAAVFSLSAEKKEASLITAWPGSEIYELCGHEALRIKGETFDSVWNFGTFDFNEPNFVYRFVKGETDYMVMGYPFIWFLPEYEYRGSRVEEQVLNLTPEEIDRLQNLLDKYASPPLNRYRYNYIKDNCSTKIASLLDSVAGGNVTYTDEVKFRNYRDAMRHYHANYPWYQFGIDLALGSGLEEELGPKEELFIPIELHRHATKALLPDGRPLVKETRVLYPGTETAVSPPTPFLLTPLWVSIVVLAGTVILLIVCWRKNCIPKVWYAVFFGLEGLAGCLVAFLVCISEHAATSPNLLIFWLNPLQLLVPVWLWWRQMRYPLAGLMWINIAAVGMLLVIMPIFDRGQMGQTSFILLMITDLLLAAYYLWMMNISQKKGKRSSKGKYKKTASRRRKK